MIKRNYPLITVTGAIIILLLILFSAGTNKKSNDKLLKIESVAIPVASGWGYNILVDNKVFIHQEYIPAIMGKKKFASKGDAMRTAAIAIKKLKQGKQPAITQSDLAALKIAL